MYLVLKRCHLCGKRIGKADPKIVEMRPVQTEKGTEYVSVYVCADCIYGEEKSRERIPK